MPAENVAERYTTELLTPDEVEQLYKISTAEQTRLRKRRGIPFVQTGQRKPRYRRADLDVWIKERIEQRATEAKTGSGHAVGAWPTVGVRRAGTVVRTIDIRGRERPAPTPDYLTVRARVEAIIAMDDDWHARSGDNIRIAELIGEGCTADHVAQIRSQLIKRGTRLIVKRGAS